MKLNKSFESNPAVSIVVPAYNAAKYIYSCMDSILGQTNRDFELIVVDDGSTDSTLTALESYSNDLRVRIVHQENSGVSVARNRGISMARGEFILFVDSDDVLHPEFISRCLTLANKDDCDFVLVSFEEFDEEGEPCFKPIPLDDFTFVNNPLQYYLDNGYKGAMFTMFVRRSLIDGLKFPEGISRGEDLCFSFSLLARLSKGFHIKAPLYFYRRTQGSLDRSALTVKDVVFFGQIMRCIFRVYENDKDKLRVIKRRLFPKMVKNIIKRMVSEISSEDAAKIYAQISSLLNDDVVGYSGFSLRWRWRLWSISLKYKYNGE